MLESDQPVVAERPPTKLAKDGSPLYYAHYKTPDGRWNRFHDLRHTYAAMMISGGEHQVHPDPDGPLDDLDYA